MTDETWLREAPLQVLGRLPDSSNNALLCSIASDSGPVRVVYKPQAGERPLWDFPSGTLCRRERAAAVLDTVLGWGLVPATAWRSDGPAGPGIVQEWIDGDVDLAVFPPGKVPEGWVGVVDAETADGPVVVAHRADEATLRMVVFDALANNADRKGGHLLRTENALYGIDHGVTFHVEPKLRTVLWGLAGASIPESLLTQVADAMDGLDALEEWLTTREVEQTRRRADRLLSSEAFPSPSGEWPALPWPLI
ncbi:MAG TPA: SCO1664 family protein [Actinomycetota bacterium]|nr:SCO1664 family protein [Actinomycetota bacterium]HNO15432.1 SCO1664 family protein [Actinomycetota bacterium]